MQLIVGVDPGKSGGIAVVSELGEVLDSCKTPDTPTGILRYLEDWKHASLAVIEKVGGYNKSAGFQPGSHMFQFGLVTGLARMALVACGLKIVEVAPRRWQGELRVTPRRPNETKEKFKRRLRQLATELFPEAGPTLYTADALLLAEWGRRRLLGKLQKGLFA